MLSFDSFVMKMSETSFLKSERFLILETMPNFHTEAIKIVVVYNWTYFGIGWRTFMHSL